MAETLIAAPAVNNDEIWEFLNRISRPTGGGSDEDVWEGLGVPEAERVSWGERFKGAVDGVTGFLKGLHLPKLRGESAGAAEPAAAGVEPEGAGRNRFFGWLGEIGRRFNEWRRARGGGVGEPEVPAPAVPEGEVDRFGWLKNGLKWLKGAPGGLVNKFRRQPEAAAVAKISRGERVKALKEGTGQFLKNWGPEIAVGLLGGFLGYSTGSIETMRAAGNFAPAVIEMGAILTAGVGSLGLIIGDERGPEAIPDAEGRFGRVATAIRRGLSNKAVRRGLKLVTFGSGGFAIGGIGRQVVEVLQVIQPGAAGTPAPAEVTGAVNELVATGGRVVEAMTPEQLAAVNAGWQEPAAVVAQNAANVAGAVEQAVIQQVAGAADIIAQVNQALSGISSEVLGNTQVDPLAKSAQQALGAARQFYADAQASGGGIDASEAAHLQSLVDAASQAANQAVDAAKQVAQQIADAAANTATARQAAETLASAPVAEIGKNLVGGTVWGNELALAQSLGLDHAVPVANAMKNFAYAFTQGQPFTGIGPESSVNLLNRDAATWLAGQLNGIIGQRPSTLNHFQKMIWEIGYAGRHANATDLAQLAKEFASQTVH